MTTLEIIGGLVLILACGIPVLWIVVCTFIEMWAEIIGTAQGWFL